MGSELKQVREAFVDRLVWLDRLKGYYRFRLCDDMLYFALGFLKLN